MVRELDLLIWKMLPVLVQRLHCSLVPMMATQLAVLMLKMLELGATPVSFVNSYG